MLEQIKKIEEDLKGALKRRDKVCLDTVRSIKTAVRNKEVELKRPLNDEKELFQVINSLVKQRREAIEQFEKGGRQDLVNTEKKELEILLSYLPPPLTDSELKRIVDEAVSESGAAGPGDMGKVMKIVMAKVAGRADGKLINLLVVEKLKTLGT